ncbi:unnamed protein product [Adineta steineri]|uniref:Uncharacterized protein n=1 Tax=Adineta steineri TaxID=433720 RepID=A0A815FZP0_9BILA|nr:unnamed protein product [Adineta steineri]CAF3969133.1 unnamed protein product [Adineta steineri]
MSVRCQNQVNTNSQVSVDTSSEQSVLSSSPPRSSSLSSNDAKLPHSSASSPSSKQSQVNRFPVNNTPALPSYPPLPPSHHRVTNNITTSSSSGSSSSADASRSLPSADINQSNDARARRRLRVRQSNPLSINDQQDANYLYKVSQNDTLQRRKRDQQINNHLKQYQQISSDDEHELLSNANPPQAVVVVAPPKRLVRPNSSASSVESNYSKLSFDDDVYLNERESKITMPYDSNNNLPNSKARQRRRENRNQSSIESSNQVITNNSNHELSHSTSQDSISTDIEKKKEGEKDMNDLLFMLTATLRLAPPTVTNVQDSDLDPNELTNSSNDSDKTVVDNGYNHSPTEEQIPEPWSLDDRTMEIPLHQTNRFSRRCEILRQDCLREISPEKLRRVLNIVENVSQAQMTEEMIDELGEYLYQKYAPQIYLLKFYEDNLRTHT